MKKYLLIIANAAADLVEALTMESNNYAVSADAMLIPYGDHPHKNGIQRFTREHADTMVSNFNSVLGKLGRLFGGLPVYVGHPDDPAFANQHQDNKSYAWIMGMEARDEGLALIPKWSKPGEDIISNAHYKWFSPRWACKEIARESGKAILAPVRLISVGLTNMPQIAGIQPLANEELAEGTTPAAETKEKNIDLLKRLLAALGMADTATEDDLCAKIAEMNTALASAAAATEAANTAANSARAELETERGARRELIVSNAIAAGILTPAQKDQWLTDLAADFAGKSVELSNMKPAFHVTPITTNLGARKTELQSTRDKVLTLVNQRMSEQGEDYETAFAAVRKEHTALFSTMKQPQSTK